MVISSASAGIMATTDMALAIATIWKLKTVGTTRDDARALVPSQIYMSLSSKAVTQATPKILLIYCYIRLRYYTVDFPRTGDVAGLPER